MKKTCIAIVIVGLSSSLAAQRGSLERSPDPAAYAQLYEKMVGEVRARMAVEAKVTTGAPYSAEAITWFWMPSSFARTVNASPAAFRRRSPASDLGKKPRYDQSGMHWPDSSR